MKQQHDSTHPAPAAQSITIRQLFYALVSRQVLKNTQDAYRALASALAGKEVKHG